MYVYIYIYVCVPVCVCVCVRYAFKTRLKAHPFKLAYKALLEYGWFRQPHPA